MLLCGFKPCVSVYSFHILSLDVSFQLKKGSAKSGENMFKSLGFPFGFKRFLRLNLNFFHLFVFELKIIYRSSPFSMIPFG